ncbi:D-glucuronyl C5-epimerase family protein [Arthrobacter sp. 18067]|uniref:D-glucuronyl C5-epimerase family protein n=1 Tax=Arthrobacter sp. 18067 TaxID=2681413 RepID=UPI0013599861|nr:D-glucuronyl C5-epimerase family protein [Arthrobacter sp. 18067]
MGSATDYVTNEYEVSLPALRMERKAIWDYYRIEFLPNGYPGRRTDGVLMAHPIYGPYVITDYLIQYGLTKDPIFLEAAIRVADVSVAMMEPLHDGLVFNYDEERAKVSSKKGTWYSGLTQSRYVDVLSKLLAYPDTKRFRGPLKAVLTSLTIPVEDGGVARYTSDGGLIIEEYPATFPNCTLNGWTTATCILLDVAKATNDDSDWDVFNKSVRGLESIIGLYDVPELANSRYKLEGDATFQLSPAGSALEVTDCQVVVPSAGVFPANVEGDQAGEALKAGPLAIRDGKLGRVKVRLSRFSWPSPNKLLMKVTAERAALVKVAIGETTYNPFGSVPKVTGQKHLQEFDLLPGENLLEITVPWIAAEMVAHPTNFSKKLTGRQFNVYHYIHIDTLTKIVEQSGSEILRYYLDKWKHAPSLWADHPAYQDERLMLERFDMHKHK